MASPRHVPLFWRGRGALAHCAPCRGWARVGPSPPSASRPAAWAGRWAGCELRGFSATLPVRGAGELRGGEKGAVGIPTGGEGKEAGLGSGTRPGLLGTLGAGRLLALAAGFGPLPARSCRLSLTGAASLRKRALVKSCGALGVSLRKRKEVLGFVRSWEGGC